MKPRRETSDISLCLKLLEGAQRKIRPLIFGCRMLAVVGNMRDAQVRLDLGRGRIDIEEFG